MTGTTDDQNVPREVEETLKEFDAQAQPKKPKFEPSYKVMTEAKIPVSKHHGKMWKGRMERAKKAREPYEAAWKEAIKYFLHDQLDHRNSEAFERSGNSTVARRLNEMWTETENMVFANTTAMIPALYAKNPEVELTAHDKENDSFIAIFERLINNLLNMKVSPGVYIKPKVRTAIIMAHLANHAFVKVDYMLKETRDGVFEDLQRIAKELEQAKGQRDIEKLEGQLWAIEKHLDVISEEGFMLDMVSPMKLYVDPDATDMRRFTDAKWVIEEDYLPTQYIIARYGKQKEGSDQIQSLYKPTHVLPVNRSASDIENLISNFSLFDDEKTHEQYGYEDNASYEDAQRTKVYKVWDKATRRMYMFHADDWTWPLWVWDDPLGLLEFFPYVGLAFYDHPECGYMKGEVTFYLDQQDAINEINDVQRRMRLWAKNNWFFDKNTTDAETVEAIVKGPDGTIRGIDVPEGKSPDEIVFSISHPGLKFADALFGERVKQEKLGAIDRISALTDVMRGTQFKTNTTNQAIDTYNSTTQMRIDEKIDQIEEFIGDIAWKVAQLAVKYLDQAQVVAITGRQDVQWMNMTPRELADQYGMRVVGGSTIKPTSKAKKQEAIEAGQVLGQFADASPAIIIVMLRLFQQAFDEIVLTDEDWQMIIDSMQQQQQQAGAGPQGTEGQGGGGAGIEEMLAQLPPQARQAAEQAIAQGIPPEQVMAEIQNALSGATVQ